MDARPQRPVRPLRLQADENVDPIPKQAAHQRTKSASTVSNMLAVGGLKAAAKRTAFGDVSNTAKNLSSIYDDSAITGKPYQTDFVKPLALSDKPTALLRPAQRPLNAAPIKGMFNVTSTTSSDSVAVGVAPKLPLQEARPHSQQIPAVKPTLSKKNTIIYTDAPAEPNPLSLHINREVARPETAPTLSLHQILEPRQHKSQPQLKLDQPVLRRTQSKLITDTASASEKAQVREFINENSQEEAYTEYKNLVDVKQGVEVASEAPKATYSTVDRYERQLPPLPNLVSEPEEYWEDEEEEVYDEQGYTTAHSYRSQGDNTTGGATTVLFPKITNKTKKELAVAKDIVESARTTEEIEDEAWDTSMVAEYGDEIFSYMRELEIKMLPNAHYMDNQAEIEWSMRAVLMNWVIEVHQRFSLLPETLFLCVNYIDRFLSCKIVSLGKLQLVGATAIFVAAKYEEINCPSVNEIVYMVDGGYTSDEILKAERFMLSMLQFELGWPGPMSFLRRISKADDYDLETRTLAKYFLEVTIIDKRFVGCPPSYIAAGAHCISRLMLKKGDWTPAHIHYSGYTWQQLRPLVTMMMECCENPEDHHRAVYAKYCDRRYKRASLYVQTEMARGFVMPSVHVGNPRQSLPSLEDVAAHMPFEARDSFKRMVQIKG